jgi:hypothetical protein
VSAEFEFQIRLDEDQIEIFVEAATDLGLLATEIKLATRPQCRHWHFRRPKQSGTLEATWCADSSVLTLEIRRNRIGVGLRELAERLVTIVRSF